MPFRRKRASQSLPETLAGPFVWLNLTQSFGKTLTATVSWFGEGIPAAKSLGEDCSAGEIYHLGCYPWQL